MIVTLLFSLAAIAVTGMQLYAVQEHSGPFVGIQEQVVAVLGSGATSKYYWSDLHGFLVNFTLALIFLHVSAVVMSSIAHRENLPLAMVTGKKPRLTRHKELHPWLIFKSEFLWWRKRIFH